MNGANVVVNAQLGAGETFQTTLNPPDVTLKQHGWNHTPSA
jgi:hypothetical protein